MPEGQNANVFSNVVTSRSTEDYRNGRPSKRFVIAGRISSSRYEPLPAELFAISSFTKTRECEFSPACVCGGGVGLAENPDRRDNGSAFCVLSSPKNGN